jgi:chorismate mutase
MKSVNLELEPFVIPGLAEKEPLIMAGPCSAETEKQVMDTARQLAGMGIKVFRAGIWKPRTRPNSFEGVGSEGLKWLEKVKRETGMLVTIEVANVKHVYQALRYNIDIIWIGARTTANPFAVQEIADAIEDTEIPVMVKNPVNPDIELWIGALERFNQAGIKRLAAIHRGFNRFQESEYRNEPHWQIPIELRRRVPNLPIFTDPSHICGNRHMLFDVSQKALDLNFNGLLIESHINPDEALSDRAQQLKPEDLKKMIGELQLRKEKSLDEEFITDLEELRREIDKIDDEILKIIIERMRISEKIGVSKKRQNVTILQTDRWNEILEKRLKKGTMQGLSDEFIEKLFKAIHQESINHQNRVMNQ